MSESPRPDRDPPVSEAPAADVRRHWSDHYAVGLTGIVGLALALRLYAVHRANSSLPNSVARLGGDEPGYDEFARLLQHGHWSHFPVRGLGYPALLAVLRTLTGGDYDLILYAQAFVSTGTVLLAFLLGRELFGRLAGLLAAAGVAVHWTLVLEPSHLQSEILYTPLLLTFLIVLLHGLRRPSVSTFVVAGAVLGVMNLTRPTTLAFAPMVALLLVMVVKPRSEILRGAAALVVVSYLVVIPATVANAFRYRAFLPVATTTGVLWQGSPEYYDLQQSGRTYASIWDNELNPQRNGGHWVGTIEGDNYFTRRALRSIRDRPATYAWYSVEKVAWFWVGHPSADWATDTVLDPRSLTPYFPRWEVAMMMLSRVVPIAALAALGILVVRRALKPTLFPLVLLIVYFTIVHALTWAELRLSQPLAPVLWILIAGAAASVLPYRHGSTASSPSVPDEKGPTEQPSLETATSE